MIPLKDDVPADRPAILTYVLIAINVIAYLVASGHAGSLLGGPSTAVSVSYGAIPFELTHPGSHCRLAGAGVISCLGHASTGSAAPPTWLTPLSAMFVHGSMLHLAGNMLFLYIFGNTLEHAIGRWRFLAFYLMGGLAALALQVLLDPNAAVPTLGASGAISAVLGGYILLYPRARVLCVVLIVFFFTLIELPALAVLGIWFLLQAALGAAGLADPVGGAGVAYLAHSGGFVVGLASIRTSSRSIAALALAGGLLAAALLLVGCSGSGAPPGGAIPPPGHLSGSAGAMPGGPRRAMAAFHRPARAGILVDLDTGRVLWQRKETRVLPIASLTKMMTALLVVRRARADDPVLITKEALAYRGSGVGLLPRGRHVPLEPLLYGLLLPSGNDAAIALAQHVAGSVPAFVAAMNATAVRLHLRCTHFTSPDGFDDANRSCAADLAQLARIDLAQPRIARIAARRSAVLPFPIKHGKLYLYNNNPLERRGFPGITGLKTGETNAAGLCLVATARRGRIRLVSVLLNAPDLARQSAALLESGFRAEGAR